MFQCHCVPARKENFLEGKLKRFGLLIHEAPRFGSLVLHHQDNYIKDISRDQTNSTGEINEVKYCQGRTAERHA